jgi:DNA-binding transcriptional ArsR family regulator
LLSSLDSAGNADEKFWLGLILAFTETLVANDMLSGVFPPRRREILRLVWNTEQNACKISSHINITLGAVSQHLKFERVAGAVSLSKRGRFHFCPATATPSDCSPSISDPSGSPSLIDSISPLKARGAANDRRSGNRRHPSPHGFRCPLRLVLRFVADPDCFRLWMADATLGSPNEPVVIRYQ